MSTTSYIAAHRRRYIGPQLLQTIVQGLETGYIISQSIRFWNRADMESRGTKALVAFVSVIAFFQTAADDWNTWMMFVDHFGDFTVISNPSWSRRIAQFLTALMGSPVQSFLIWRCWVLMGRRWLVMIPLASILIVSFAASVLIVFNAFQMSSNGPHLSRHLVDVAVILSLALPAFIDVVVTFTLLAFLLRSRADAHSRRFRRAVARLMTIAWEAALPPCMCALIAAITHPITSFNPWDLAFQTVLGKLYVIALFVTLNGRAEIDAERLRSFTLPTVALSTVNQEAHNLTAIQATPECQPTSHILLAKNDHTA